MEISDKYELSKTSVAWQAQTLANLTLLVRFRYRKKQANIWVSQDKTLVAQNFSPPV